MKYDIALVATTDAVKTITVDPDAGGYWRTDDTGTFFELSPARGMVELYPLVNLRQIVIEEQP